MIPSRKRLEGWTFGPISAVAADVAQRGRAIETAGAGVARRCEQLPALKAWDGLGHASANEAFGVAKGNAVAVADLTDNLSAALTEGYWSLSSAKQKLMDKVAEIEGGRFLVHNKWAVTIKPGRMSQDEARELIKERDRLQTELNPMVSAMGAADDSTAAAVTGAAEAQGYSPIRLGVPGQLAGLTPPQDDIIDPTTPMGLLMQRGIAEADAAMTVASKVPGVNAKGEEMVTVFMQDGSKRIITESTTYAGSWYERPMTVEEMFDPTGKLVSTTNSFELDSGQQRTSIVYADKTRVEITTGPDGRGSCRVFPQGKEPIEVPPDSEFFSHPILTTVGGVLSSADTYGGHQLEKALPTLTRETMEEIHYGGKYGGPALAVGVALYDVLAADNEDARCRAMYSGIASAAGGYAGGVAGAAVPGVGVVTSGLFSVGGSFLFGYLGSELGKAMCY